MRESNDQFANIDNPYDFARVFHLRVLGPRAEPPEAIAPHYLACIDRLKQVHPAYDNWIFNLKGKPKKFDALREKLAEVVAGQVDRARMAKPTPIYGYGRLSPIP